MEEPVVLKHLVYVQSVEHRAEGIVISFSYDRFSRCRREDLNNKQSRTKIISFAVLNGLSCYSRGGLIVLSVCELTEETCDCLSPCCSQVLHSRTRPGAALWRQHNTKRKYVWICVPTWWQAAVLHMTFVGLKCRENCKLTVFAEDRRGDEVLEDAAVSVEWTNHLTPHQELAHLLCKLPQFLLVHSDNRLYDTSFIGLISLAHEDTENTQKGDDEEKCNVPFSHRGEAWH